MTKTDRITALGIAEKYNIININTAITLMRLDPCFFGVLTFSFAYTENSLKFRMQYRRTNGFLYLAAFGTLFTAYGSLLAAKGRGSQYASPNIVIVFIFGAGVTTRDILICEWLSGCPLALGFPDTRFLRATRHDSQVP